jgi:hypothetical protein
MNSLYVVKYRKKGTESEWQDMTYPHPQSMDINLVKVKYYRKNFPQNQYRIFRA